MPLPPPRLIVVADRKIARVDAAWPHFQSFLAEQPDLAVVAVDHDGTLDFRARQADLVIVLGGDGAILRACRQMGEHQLPVLGVNHGRLGFLADLSPQEFRDNFHRIIHREYHVVEYLMFECRLGDDENPRREVFLGLNEVVVSSGASLRMVDVHLEINGEPVTTYSSDGLIVGTAVGSTGHSMSAGGPILRQDLQAFVITPICPHTLTNRPLVDSADCVFRLEVPRAPEGTMLVIDGQIRRPISERDFIEVTRAPVSFRMAKVPGSSYYATLHRKLGWGGRPNYRNE